MTYYDKAIKRFFEINPDTPYSATALIEFLEQMLEIYDCEAEMGWIPCTSLQPKNGELVCVKHFNGRKDVIIWSNYANDTISHWKPIN